MLRATDPSGLSADASPAWGDGACPAQSISRHATALRRGYAVAFTILVAVALSSFLVQRHQLGLHAQAEKTRNLLLQQSGDLSKVHGIVSLVLDTIDRLEEQPELRGRAIAELQRVALRLRNRQSEIDSQLQRTHRADPGVSSLSRKVTGVADAIVEIASIDQRSIGWRFSLWAPLMLEIAYEGPLMTSIQRELKAQDDLVNAMEQRSQTNVAILTAIALCVLALEVALIFVPLLRHFQRLGARLHRTTRELQHAAQHDALTGAGNRTLLRDVVEGGAASAPRTTALMVVDIDDFKSINDVYGHPTGDGVLRAITRRMDHSVGQRGQVFRTGGDEFVVTWFEPCDADVVRELARKLLDDIGAPLSLATVGDAPVFCSAAIGVAMVEPGSPLSLVELMRAADLALRDAKQPNTANIAVYGYGSTLHQRDLLALGSKFAAALDRGEIVPFYQPVVDLDSGAVVAFEALARWASPELGLRMPAEFLPIAEQNHQTGVLTQTLLLQVAGDRRRFRSAGLQACDIAVNFTEIDLIDHQIRRRVLQCVGSEDISWLTIEVVETALLHRSWQRIQANLLRFVADGAKVSLDDFGTGFASLQHLLSVPCKSIKVDRSFVAEVLNDPNAQMIIRGMVDMALGLSIDVVIEGIETQAQADFFRLRWRGLRAQGYWFGEPVDADQVLRHLKERTWVGPSQQFRR